MRSPARRIIGHSAWPWISLTPFGLGAWAPIYAGVKAHRRPWVLLGLLWTLIVLGAWVLTAITNNSNQWAGTIGGLIMAGWLGTIVTSFAIRGAYDQLMRSPLQEAIDAGESRIAQRRRAAELARRNPELAREIGIGRPDRLGAADVGLVDINNASITALLKLPGITDVIATQIIEGRRECHGFSSLEDMGLALDLDGNVVEGLRDRTIFLPRAG
jgi:hypothetical protein